MVGTQDYDAFGATRSQTGVQLPFTYTGEQVDPESGLVYLRNRYLDPATGCFLTPDPLGFVASGVNLYTYTHNSPVDSVDPLGLYDYQYQWYLGAVSGAGSPQHVMEVFQSNPQAVFPFSLGACSTIQLGEVCGLSPIPFKGPQPVQVTNVTCTSFTFTALPGHFDRPGSTITFSIVEKNGNIYLQQTAHAKRKSGIRGWLSDKLAPFAAKEDWELQGANLAELVNPNFPDPSWPEFDGSAY